MFAATAAAAAAVPALHDAAIATGDENGNIPGMK